MLEETLLQPRRLCLACTTIFTARLQPARVTTVSESLPGEGDVEFPHKGKPKALWWNGCTREE